MKPSHATTERDATRRMPAEEFSLVLGGPLYQLLLRMRLARPPLALVHRRMLVIAALAWLPLLALTAREGTAWGGVGVPFLLDIEAYARFLLAMPLLIWAELPVHQRSLEIVQQFRERNVIPDRAMPEFDAVVARAMRLRNSRLVEVSILVLVLALGPLSWQSALGMQTDTWYASAETGQAELTRAGWWFVHVSVPMFQFLLLRWYFRLLVWWRFLWMVSRLPLDLRASHPDRAGGLGFLGDSGAGFAVVLFAQGSIVSGLIASRVLAGGRSALEFRAEVVVLVLVMVAMILGPLLFFTRAMTRARSTGLREYGAFAATVVREFDHKWIDGKRPDEPLVGSPDISSLADLGGCLAFVREMKIVPFERRMLLQLVAATTVPFLPLVLTVIPLTELINRVFKMLL